MISGGVSKPLPRADVITVTYGSCEAVVPLLESLRVQAGGIERIFIWHNGPTPFDRRVLDPFRDLPVQVQESGENLGYGGGVNRSFCVGQARVAVVVNPDVSLADDAVFYLVRSASEDPNRVLVGGALGDHNNKVNAFALALTADGVGINVDRGDSFDTFRGEQNAKAQTAAVAPSGALFAVNRLAWEALGGGPLFVESLFLYLEDLALGMRVRRLGGGIAFCAEARGEHRFSDTTGRRRALKLYYVERNRLWLQRALGGRSRAGATLPFTFGRLLAYLAQSLGRAAGPTTKDASDPGAAALVGTLLRAWKAGLGAPLPPDLVPYLGPNLAGVSFLDYLAPLKAQFRDPTA